MLLIASVCFARRRRGARAPGAGRRPVEGAPRTRSAARAEAEVQDPERAAPLETFTFAREEPDTARRDASWRARRLATRAPAATRAETKARAPTGVARAHAQGPLRGASSFAAAAVLPGARPAAGGQSGFSFAAAQSIRTPRASRARKRTTKRWPVHYPRPSVRAAGVRSRSAIGDGSAKPSHGPPAPGDARPAVATTEAPSRPRRLAHPVSREDGARRERRVQLRLRKPPPAPTPPPRRRLTARPHRAVRQHVAEEDAAACTGWLLSVVGKTSAASATAANVLAGGHPVSPARLRIAGARRLTPAAPRAAAAAAGAAAVAAGVPQASASRRSAGNGVCRDSRTSSAARGRFASSFCSLP